MGSGTLAAMSVLESRWQPNMEEEDAKQLVTDSTKHFVRHSVPCSTGAGRNPGGNIQRYGQRQQRRPGGGEGEGQRAVSSRLRSRQREGSPHTEVSNLTGYVCWTTDSTDISL